MSIQPNRVLARIIEQVDASDWPVLDSTVRTRADGLEWTRFFSAPVQARYATPLHFWVHALRDELAARSRREDLIGVAGHALCQQQSFDAWHAEVGHAWPEDVVRVGRCEIYRMQANECRRSSIASIGDRLRVHFWGHGCGASWRRAGSR